MNTLSKFPELYYPHKHDHLTKVTDKTQSSKFMDLHRIYSPVQNGEDHAIATFHEYTLSKFLRGG